MSGEHPYQAPVGAVRLRIARFRAAIENGTPYSTVTACILLFFGVMLLIDLWGNPTGFSARATTVMIVLITGSSLFGSVMAVRKGEHFARWVGLAIVTFQFAVTALIVAFTSGVGIVIGNIQGLPILSLYLGCFYVSRTARLTAIAGVSAIIAAAVWGPNHDQVSGLGIHSAPELLRLTLFVILCVELGRYWRERIDLHTMIDELTGAFTRRAMAAVGDREIARSLRYDLPLTLVLVDLDDFKCVNDTEGHTVGDELLRTVVGQWLNSIRKQDTVYRLGGDEFVFFLPNTNAKEAQLLLARLRADAVHPWSWGVTEILDGDTVATAILRADRAMYAAKRAQPARPEHDKDVHL